MDNHFLMTDDMLWDYADGLLNPDEKGKVDAYLVQHPEWQRRLETVLDDKKALASILPEKPDDGFSAKVMTAWALEQMQARVARPDHDRIIRIIALVFGLFVFVPVVLMVLSAGEMANIRMPFDLPELPSIDWAELMSHPALHYALYLGITFLGLRMLELFLQRNGVLRLKD